MGRHFERLSAPELDELLRGGTTTAIVPFGSVERHGPHLPVGSDAILADAVGPLVADRLGAVLAPTVRIGHVAAHGVGTLGVQGSTLERLAVEIGESLVAQGFRTVVLLSTHGGNGEALRAAAGEAGRALPQALILAPEGDLGPHPGSHSGEWLTSVMLAICPDQVLLERADPDQAQELASASAARGAEHLERFVASVVEQVRRARPRPPAPGGRRG